MGVKEALEELGGTVRAITSRSVKTEGASFPSVWTSRPGDCIAVISPSAHPPELAETQGGSRE